MKNRDLDTPEVVNLVPISRNKTNSKSVTPDAEQFIVDRAGQVKSLLDQTNLHETTSLSRGGLSREPSQMDIDADEPRHGSVQKMREKFDTQESSMVSATAKLYVKDLF